MARACNSRHAEYGQVTATNRVFTGFSDDARRRLQPYLEPVGLPAGKILYEAGDAMRHVIFPEHGVVALVASTSDGATTEVAVIGREGVVGLPSMATVTPAPYQVLVQLAGDGYRVRVDILRVEFRRDPSVQDAVLDDLHRLLQQMAQSVVCNRYHTARQRLCRWLLMTHDRVATNTIPLTQEFLCHMLGATRKRVSYAAAQLQDAGCIRQRHGQIRILDRRGLEQRSCECYCAIAQPRPAPTATYRTHALSATSPAAR
jgi:CRP-like cAMP-binding protein